MTNRTSIRAFTILLAVCCLLAVAVGSAQESQPPIEPRIGLKSEAVLLNDLEQLGLAEAEIVELGRSARVRVRVEAGTGIIEVDRQTAEIRITEASPQVRRAIKARVPAVHMAPSRQALPMQQDCVAVDPAAVQTKRVQGRWKIVDDGHFLFDFGEARGDAKMAAEVLRHYRITQSCFVGRPDPSFTYLLASGEAPSGVIDGEDCLSFNPAELELVQADGRWKLAQGSRWLFDFGDRREEAGEALEIIRQYGFTQSCFVGRPNPSFTYLRR